MDFGMLYQEDYLQPYRVVQNGIRRVGESNKDKEKLEKFKGDRTGIKG